jgi:putative PIN family toxin of toxin-antitoxin system
MLLVMDTDVLAAAVMSATGASRFILREVGQGRLPAAASVPLMLEYEAVLKRPETLARSGGTTADMDVILDALAAVLQQVPIWYLWRPQLRDPNDDMVLEAAANAQASHIVTFNVRDYGLAPKRFGITVCRPAELVRQLKYGQE